MFICISKLHELRIILNDLFLLFGGWFIKAERVNNLKMQCFFVQLLLFFKSLLLKPCGDLVLYSPDFEFRIPVFLQELLENHVLLRSLRHSILPIQIGFCGVFSLYFLFRTHI